LYYGGTAYENRQGLGKLLSNASIRNEKVILPEVSIGNMVFPDPQKDVDLLAVPISILYDRGLLLQKTALLDQRISAPFIIMNAKTSKDRSFIAGETLKVTIDGEDYPVELRVDESVSTSHVLVPTSLGMPLEKPILVKVHR
jgi:hypothetical protein